MRIRFHIRSVLSLLFCLLVFACVHQKEQPGEDDVLTVPTEPSEVQAERLDIFSGTQAGLLLSQHLRVVTNFTEGAARRERVSLQNLRRQDQGMQEQLVAELLSAYYRLDERDYDLRWLTVHLLGQLKETKALGEFVKIAESELPAEKLVQIDAHQSSREQELAIRLAAVGGLVELASDDNQAANDELLKLVLTHPLRAVKVQALYGYLYAPARVWAVDYKDGGYENSDLYNRRLKALRNELPGNLENLLDIKPATQLNMFTPVEVTDRKSKQDKYKRRTSDAPRISETKRGGE